MPRPAPHPAPLPVIVTGRPACCLIRPHGEIDLATAPDLARALTGPAPVSRTGGPSAADAYDRLVVDLRDVDFMDCSGLRVLCAARRLTRRRGGWTRLVYRQPRLHLLLAGTGLDEVFPRYPTVRAARAGEPAAGPPPADRRPRDARVR